MGFLRRSRKLENSLAEQRAPAAPGGLPEEEITAVLRDLDLPYQRREDLWLVEVGGAWAVLGWMPEETALSMAIAYESHPSPASELVRLNAEPGVAGHTYNGEEVLRRALVPMLGGSSEGVPAGLRALAREASGEAHPEPPAGRPDLAAGLEALGLPAGERVDSDLGPVRLSLRDGVLDARLALEEPVLDARDEQVATWMLQLANGHGARLGADSGGLAAICGVSAATVDTPTLAWAIEQPLRLARLYRELT